MNAWPTEPDAAAENPDEKKQTLSWMIGILLLSFIDSNYILNFNLSHYNINNLTQDKYQTIYTIIYTTYGPDLALYLHADPTQRPDILKPLPVVNTPEKIIETYPQIK